MDVLSFLRMKDTQFNAFYSHKEENADWKHYVWHCFLETKKGKVIVHFKMGLAHAQKLTKDQMRWGQKPKPLAPKIEDVLCSLLTDSEALHMSFEDWCDTFGYDSDSISAFELYRVCTESGKKLNTLYSHQEIKEIREQLKDY